MNYKVPQTVRQTSHPTGSVKRLSVAVLVDGKNTKTVGKDGVSQSKNEAWSADKLKEFEDLVASTVGIDKKRGDMLEVKNMEFTKEDFEALVAAWSAARCPGWPFRRACSTRRW